MQNAIPVITVDGPTASGKGTIAGEVARRLGFTYLDSGALFRLAALSCQRAGIDPTDELNVARIAREMRPVFEEGKIWLEGEDVSMAIRQESIGILASKIAVLPQLRQAILALEHDFVRAPGLVADGRDMGTVVFPDAALKVFLTASSEARAKRRYIQLIEKGISANLASLSKDLEERDRRDRERKNSPTLPAADAHLLDSSEMTVEETVECVLRWARESL